MSDLKRYIDNLKGNLPFDDKVLLDNDYVRKEMEAQWDRVPDVSAELLDDKKEMWQNISEHTYLKKYKRKSGMFWMYGVAASLLLIAGVLLYKYNTLEKSIVYIVCTGNQDKNILALNDGTKVKLGAGSKLTYPGEFPSDERIVQLEGQAFFDVAKDSERPFSVEISNVIVTALGTSFEVFHDKHNNTIETILLSGEIKVEYQDSISEESKSEVVYPNQKLTVSLENGEVNIQTENADKYSAWRNYNGLDFTDEKLSVIIPRLEYWYGCQIVYDKDEIFDERFTFKIKNESLDRILNLIYQTASIGYKKDADGSVYTLFLKK